MGDKVYRVKHKYYDDSALELYKTPEEAETAIKQNSKWLDPDGSLGFCAVPYELPDGVHLLGDGSGDNPFLRVYRPACVEGYSDERYVFDDEDVFWRWVKDRWPIDNDWRVVDYHGKTKLLEGIRDDQYGWWVAAIVRNVNNREASRTHQVE